MLNEQKRSDEQERPRMLNEQKRSDEQERPRMLNEQKVSRSPPKTNTSCSKGYYDAGRQAVANEVTVREDPSITGELVVGGIGIAVGAAGVAAASLLAAPAAPVLGIGAALLGGATALFSLGKMLYKKL